MGLLFDVSQNRLEDARDRLVAKRDVLGETDNSGNTALHLAAEKGFVEMVKLLVEFEAQLDCHNKCSGWTPLHFAAYEGKICNGKGSYDNVMVQMTSKRFCKQHLHSKPTELG